ncbi:MAG: polysaccharide deacetylase family protein [Desulfitobacteriaceae bacterium]
MNVIGEGERALAFVLIGLVLMGIVIFVYTFLPDLFLHRMGVGSWKRQFTAGVALTFDDGPDPEITPRVLDILKEFGVPATFFVVGEKAIRYPEIIKRIIADGHTLGLHSWLHRYAWFMSPWSTWREWETAAQALERLSGRPLEWMRPPWGTFNFVTWLWLKSRGKRAVLWNVQGKDWKENLAPEEILKHILKKTKEGSIILLHDGGLVAGERKKVLFVLEGLCENIVKKLKLPFIRLEFPLWSGRRRLVFVLWEKWEHLFAKVYRVERIDATNMLRLGKTRYKGPDLYAEDGGLLAKSGDLVGEIHLDSIRLQGQDIEMRKLGIKALRMTRESLPVLARYVAESPEYQGIKVFLGLTVINRGVKGLGFSVQEVPSTLATRWVGSLQKVVMSVYHPAGKSRLNKRLGDTPKLVWIAKNKLLELWLPLQGSIRRDSPIGKT